MRVEFRSGGFQIAAILDAPRESAAKAYAIFAPCFTCNKNIKTAAYLGRGLAERGIAMLRLDFRGLGESEGDFSEATLTTNVEDIIAAANFLAEHYGSPTLLIGHSFGGPAVIRAAPKIASCRAVVTINSPADPRQITSFFADRLPEIEKNGVAQIDIVGRPFPIGRNFIHDLENQNHPEAITRLGKPLLICHSPADDVALFSEALEMFRLASEPKSFFSIDQADHYLFKREDADYVASVIVAWASRYWPA